MAREQSTFSITGTRSNCWSITINNPTKEDTDCALPPGWRLEGQYEKGEQETEHFQGMLSTPQVRFSAVKKQFPRAHIEVARSKQALKKYVSKEETRVGEYAGNATMNMFQSQDLVASLWSDDEYQSRCMDERILKMYKCDTDAIALAYVDNIVEEQIEAGVIGLEFTAINPMWRSSWKRFHQAIIGRYKQTHKEEELNEIIESHAPPVHSPCL